MGFEDGDSGSSECETLLDPMAPSRSPFYAFFGRHWSFELAILDRRRSDRETTLFDFAAKRMEPRAAIICFVDYFQAFLVLDLSLTPRTVDGGELGKVLKGDLNL